MNRAPFDLPEAETELVAGYLTEYAGFRWSLYFLAEYVNMLTVSAIATICFLGGWKGPFLSGPLWFAIKMAFFVFLFVWVRATLPRIRYDRLMRLGWDVLLPLALAESDGHRADRRDIQVVSSEQLSMIYCLLTTDY